jgi:Fungal tRNA ligase phosphodiesterase domain
MTADIATSQARFTSQLMERVSEVDTGSYSVVEYDAPSAFIKLVAVDVSVGDVHVLLRDMAKDSRLAPLMKQFSVDPTNHTMLPSVDWDDSQFIPKTHVTMAHFKEATQGAMRVSFGKLVGEVVEVSVTAVLWDKKVAALEVQLPAVTTNGNDLPKSKNEFSHVTIWCEKGTKAVASNELPGLVERGEAQRVSLDQPVVLPGTVALWTL